jgi:hypothetical protein
MLSPGAGSEVGAAASKAPSLPGFPPMMGLRQVRGHIATTQAHRNTRVTAPEPNPRRTLALHS